MTSKNTAYARMIRQRKPTRGAAHALMEDLADSLFRGPAKTDHGIDLVVLTAAAQRLAQKSVLAQLPDAAVPHLMSRLGDEDPATGLLVFDGVLADALIEQQTLGRVSSTPRVERAVTAIDAALSSAFATSVLTKMESLTAENARAVALQGYSCGRPQIDRANLSLALSGKHYDVLCVELDLGPGLKRGTVQLIVPASAEAETTAARVPTRNPEMVVACEDAVLNLRVILPAIKVPLRTLLALKTDTVLPLSPDALSKARLVDLKGRRVTTGKLGQFKGNRAVRVDVAVPVVPLADQVSGLAEIKPDLLPETVPPTVPADHVASSGDDFGGPAGNEVQFDQPRAAQG